MPLLEDPNVSTNPSRLIWSSIVSDLREPFSLRKGWLLWAGIGLVGAIGAISLTGAAMSLFSSENPQREVRNLSGAYFLHFFLSF